MAECIMQTEKKEKTVVNAGMNLGTKEQIPTIRESMKERG